jgi:hypothetical protein
MELQGSVEPVAMTCPGANVRGYMEGIDFFFTDSENNLLDMRVVIKLLLLIISNNLLLINN